MHKIDIQKTTFKRLQRHAEPLVDPNDSVINHALDALEMQSGTGRRPKPNEHTIQPIGPAKLPDLRHTKVISASISQQALENPKWNGILKKLLIISMQRLGSFDELERISSINMKEGHYEASGYKYIKQANISVQGTSANDACHAIVKIAEQLNIDLAITIQWRQKEGAKFPNQKRRLILKHQA